MPVPLIQEYIDIGTLNLDKNFLAASRPILHTSSNQVHIIGFERFVP